MHMAVRVADRLGLPGPSPESFMRCHDKLEARRWQQRIKVPEATPRFALSIWTTGTPIRRCRSRSS